MCFSQDIADEDNSSSFILYNHLFFPSQYEPASYLLKLNSLSMMRSMAQIRLQNIYNKTLLLY